MKRIVLVAALAAALVAGCSAGSTPPLPSVAPPASSSAAPTPTPQPPAGCNDDNRVQSYAPAGQLPAPNALPAGSTMAKIRAKGHITVGVSADNLLFGYRNPISGKLEGFDIDMADQVAEAIFGNPQGRVQYVVMNFAQRIPALQANTVDMVADIMTITCARWAQIAFSTEYFAAGQQMLVRKNSPYQKPGDLNGRAVCAAQGSSGQKNLQQLFPKVKPRIVDNISDCMVLFQQASVEGIISDNTVVAGFASQDPYARVLSQKITDEPYGLGFNKSNIDLVRFVNALLAKLRTDGTWATIYRKWLTGSVPAPPRAAYGRALP